MYAKSRELSGMVPITSFVRPPEHNSFCSGELCFRHRLLVDFFEDFRRDIERFIPVWKIRPGIYHVVSLNEFTLREDLLSVLAFRKPNSPLRFDVDYSQ